MTSSLDTLITKPTAKVFRRAYIKRRLQTTGLYESGWYEITGYIKNWGSFSSSIDDVRLNAFTHSGLSLVARNDEGKFNPESNVTSLWYGYLTRYRTLIKIEAGYFDESDNELPTDPVQGIYLLDGEIQISGTNNQAVLNCRSIVSVFDDVRAVDVAGLGVTQTASDIIARFRDHTDGAGNFVFRQFITQTAWAIGTTSIYYNLATSTAIASMTCWELMSKLAETEGYVLSINRSGGLDFRNRDPRTTTAAMILYGQGFPRQNIIRLDEYKEALDKYYNFFRFKWREENTTTSYVTAGTTTTIDPANLSWKYGSRVYEFSNEFFTTNTTAQTVVDNLFSEFSELKEEISVEAKFLPHVEIGDRVELYYRSYDIAATTIWDEFFWDDKDWATDDGENFEWFGIGFNVLSKRTDLERFTTSLKLRRI